MNKTLAIGVTATALLFGLVMAGYGMNQPKISVPAPSQSAPVTTYTMADVQTHKDASSCWTAINGGVYDVTNWINQHPGGPEAIMSLCGTDGSAAFNDQHGGQRRPASELASFKVGTLKP